ncbi:MAG: 23S rRNA (uracil(1939)-C(5))-methyltransferase RlmD [Lachnospiraceae bacterium]|nr:23S rRNA (uracil(1939)-C(5))-methyltransferase RlmD [Lachnospiraceae bacterium]
MKNSEYTKDELLEIKITDMGNDGEGIGKVDGYTLFVKDAVIGDTVLVKIMKAKKNYAYAHLEKVIWPSPFRVEPKCPYARPCGGCTLQALDYGKQLELKASKVANNIIRIGGFDAEYVMSIAEPIVGMDEPYRYRGKSQFPFGKDKNGKVVTGFYAGRTHNIIANNDCVIGVEENREILEIILHHMEEYGVQPYDESNGSGVIRHVLIRKGFATGELMVCLVINSGVKKGEYIPAQDKLISALCRVEGMTSISISLNDKNTNVIMGDRIVNLWGRETIRDVVHMLNVDNGTDITFEISPLSFYQVNPLQMEKLYSIALQYAELTGKEDVWDLYCGIGTISLFLAKSARRVIGVEIIPEAIEDAKRNARNNGIDNATFFVGKAEEVLPEYYAQTASDEDGVGDMRHPDVIVVDPPRKGCDIDCLNTMLKMKPERIVYVSCDSATLARDLRILCDGGYSLERFRPVDMFGHSGHVETVCLLSKLHEAKHHVNVKLDMDELDLTSAEAKATYKEIEEWVQEHYGFHVTNLNIAQVKQKHGIIERENYNKPKSLDSHQQGICAVHDSR